jgi:MFS family permease
MSAGYLGMGAGTAVAQVVAFSFVGGIGNGLEGLAVVTIVQEGTPPDLQAQVNGFLESLHTAAPGLGYVLGGAIATVATPRATYWVAGIGALLVVAVAARALPPTSIPPQRSHLAPRPGSAPADATLTQPLPVCATAG